MKRRYYNILYCLIASIIFNTSCSLERNPLDQFAENEFWTNEENALIALTGIYRGNTIFNSEEYSPIFGHTAASCFWNLRVTTPTIDEETIPASFKW